MQYSAAQYSTVQYSTVTLLYFKRPQKEFLSGIRYGRSCDLII